MPRLAALSHVEDISRVQFKNLRVRFVVLRLWGGVNVVNKGYGLCQGCAAALLRAEVKYLVAMRK